MVLSLFLNLRPRRNHTESLNIYLKELVEKPEEERAECEPTRPLCRDQPFTQQLCRLLGDSRGQITQQGPHALHAAPHLGFPRHPPGSYPGRVPFPAAPVSWQPRAAASKPGQVATIRFRAHGGPAPRAHSPSLLGAPTAPGGGRDGAGTACVPAQPGWRRGWREQKLSRNPGGGKGADGARELA